MGSSPTKSIAIDPQGLVEIGIECNSPTVVVNQSYFGKTAPRPSSHLQNHFPVSSSEISQEQVSPIKLAFVPVSGECIEN